MNEVSPILASSLNAVLLVALPLFFAACITALLTWTRRQWEEFKSQQPNAAQELAYYARIAVEAAEQAGAGNVIDSKKKYAMKILSSWLQQVGLGGIDTALLEAEIERQVREMKHIILKNG